MLVVLTADVVLVDGPITATLALEVLRKAIRLMELGMALAAVLGLVPMAVLEVVEAQALWVLLLQADLTVTLAVALAVRVERQRLTE